MNTTFTAMFNCNLQNAELNNSLVVSDEVPELNTTFVNELEINYLEAGVAEVVAVYSQLLTIAMQCPYAAGPAVERARTFVAIVNDSVFYDDDAVCLQSGIYRLLDSITVLVNTENEIIVQPNPAKDQVIIAFSGKPQGICSIEFLDAIGRKVFTNKLYCEEQNITVDVSTLKQGMYSVKVNMNNSIVFVKKLSIIR